MMKNLPNIAFILTVLLVLNLFTAFELERHTVEEMFKRMHPGEYPRTYFEKS